MVGLVERVGVRGPRPITNRHAAAEVGLEVPGPVRVRRSGGDEEGPVRFLDIAHGDRHQQAGPPAARLEEGDRAPGGELSADRIVRQRLRCQDLPSVTTAGA